MTRLTIEAEIFLKNLREALAPLSDAERDAILLEYRCHLADRAAQGPVQLASCLEHMGSPAEIADELLDSLAAGGALAMREPAPPPPRSRDMPRPPQAAQELIRIGLLFRVLFRDFFATLLFSSSEIWLARLMLTSGLAAATYVDYLLGVQGTAATGHVLHYIAFVALGIAALTTAYRAMLADPVDVWSQDRDTLRFVMAMMVPLAILPLTPSLLQACREIAPATPQIVIMSLGWGLIAAGLYALVRIQPLFPAILLGRQLAFRTVWDGMRVKGLALLLGYLTILGPIFMAHILIVRTIAAESPERVVGLGLGLATADAFSQMAFVIGFAVLNSMAFRWIAGESVPRLEEETDETEAGPYHRAAAGGQRPAW